MNVILVDDNPVELKLFEVECGGTPDFAVTAVFSRAPEALAYAEKNRVDVAVLDIHMPVMDGFELAEKLRRVRREMLIVFVSADTELAARAMKMKPEYLIFKPYTREDVQDVLRRLRLMKPQLCGRVSARLFGKFDLYVDGNHVSFATKKAKELCALCIAQRGGTVSTYEILEKLWPGRTVARASDTSGYRKAIRSLFETLREYHVEDLFERRYGYCRIAPEEIDCDYYRLMDFDRTAAAAYGGQILPEYPWAGPLREHADALAEKLRT